MTLLSTSYLLASIFIISIGILVASKGYKNPINRSFSVVCLATFLWLFFYSLMLNNNFGNGLIFAKIGRSAVPYIPVALTHYTFNFLNIKRASLIIFFLYLYATVMALLTLLTPLNFSELTKYSWGLYPKGKPLILFEFIICFLITFMIIATLLHHYFNRKKSLTLSELNKLKCILVSIGIFSFATIDYLPKLGIDIIPVGNTLVIIFVSLNAYAILKHRMFDINIAIRKGVVYSLLITILTLLYFVLIFLLENVFRGLVGYKSTSLTIIIIIFFIVLFQPLKDKIQFIVDKYFFQGSIGQIKQENIQLLKELQRSERLKSVGTLAAGMAHEIKNPLTSIKIFTEYLPKKYHDKEFIDKFERIVSGEVKKINDIVSQLLDFAKPRPLEIRESNIQKLMDETLDLLSSNFINYNITMIKTYSAITNFKMDPTQIKQVFLNLIINGIESMKESGGTLTISIGLSDLEYVCISIEDTGCGISEKDLGHIFDPFFTTKETGSGLGLSIVHSIIKKHNGKIDVESFIGKGTKFIVYLPRI